MIGKCFLMSRLGPVMFTMLFLILAMATISAAQNQGAAPWRLPADQFISAKMPPVLVYPRPDTETADWARHRKTYPGLMYRIPIAVQGGAWPFLYELTEAPAGMAIGSRVNQPNYGVVTWADPQPGTHTVAVKVTDQDLTEVSVTWQLVVSKDKTLFLSPDGDDANPGTLERPKKSFAGWHKDDTDDATYQGYHVILRGGEYPWAGMASRGNNIQLHDRKPLVFLAYPDEKPVLDMSGGKFIANRGGSSAGAPDLFIHGLTLKDGDQNRPNAHFFWLTGARTERVTMFESTFMNLGPGRAGNDNPSVSFVSHTGSRRSYFAYIGNTYNSLTRSSNGVSMFDHYYTDYTVFENNHMMNISSRFGGWSKHHDDLVTYRRNTGSFSPRGDGGLLVFNPDSTTPDAKVEFCWNYLTTEGAITDRTAALIMFNHSMNRGGNVWAYRNTIVGRMENRAGPYEDKPRIAEGNVVINPGSGIRNFTGNTNLEARPDDQVINDQGHLLNAYRTQYLGTRGWEVGPEGTTVVRPEND